MRKYILLGILICLVPFLIASNFSMRSGSFFTDFGTVIKLLSGKNLEVEDNLIVGGTLNVTGRADFADVVVGKSGAFSFKDTRIQLLDNIEFHHGTDADFSTGFESTSEEWRVVTGQNIAGAAGTFCIRVSTFQTVFIPNMKTGTTQSDAQAEVGELWMDTDDGNTIKLGT